MLKAIYTYTDNDGNEVRTEVKGVISAYNYQKVLYPNGDFYTSFRVDSRIDKCVQFDIIPGAKLEFIEE